MRWLKRLIVARLRYDQLDTEFRALVGDRAQEVRTRFFMAQVRAGVGRSRRWWSLTELNEDLETMILLIKRGLL